MSRGLPRTTTVESTVDSQLTLNYNEAHIWYVRPESVKDGKLLEAYNRLLTDDERIRMNRFIYPVDRHDYLVTRALIRATLSRYASIGPEQWRFGANQLGRPMIIEPRDSRLSFNISHTSGLVACIVALRQQIGIDVEYWRSIPDLLDLAERYFSPTEVAALRLSQDEDRLKRFLEYWTLKEAYTKARGLGLSVPLSQFSFDIDGEAVQIFFGSGISDLPQSWQFSLRWLRRRHVVAVALRSDTAEKVTTSVWKTVPLS